MKFLGKLGWRLIKSVMIVIAVTVAAITIIVHFSRKDARESGFREVHLVSENSLGDKVEKIEEICNGFGCAPVMSLNIKIKKDNKESEILSYDPGNAEPPLTWEDIQPVLTWQDDHTLIVNIPRVDQVLIKVENFDGIAIKYNIGFVKYNDSPSIFDIFNNEKYFILENRGNNSSGSGSGK